MARLIRTEKEVEGRYEEVWLVVEEDALEQWPAGPARGRRPAPRRGSTASSAPAARRSTPPTCSCPGCCTPRCCARRTRTRASRSIDLAPALALPGVHAAIGPGDIPQLDRRLRLRGRGRRGRLRRHATRRRARRVAAIDVEWEVLEPLLDPDEAVRRELARSASRACASAATSSAGSPRPTSSSTGEYRTAGRAAQLDGDPSGRRAVGRRQRSRSTSRRSTSGASATRSPRRSGCPPTRCASICHYMGGGFGSKNGPDDYTFIASSSRSAPAGPCSCALTRREENLAAGNRNATIQRLTIGARSDGTLTALGGEYVNAVGWCGWSSPDRRADADALRLPEREDDDVRREDQPAADEGVPRAGLRRGHVRARGAARRARRRSSTSTRSSCAAATTPSTTRPTARPYSGKNLLECYRRAEPHWERRHEVRARSTDTVKRGVGMASQIWYGGGGPPSYAWIRVGSDGRATVVTAMQDIGTGTRTAMAQIAAEELGIPLDHVTVSLGDSARGPYASISAGSSTTPSMGPAVRAAAADAKRQIVEIAEQRCDSRARSTSRTASSLADGISAARESSGCSRTRRSSARARAARTRPACRC